jgi:gluconokinase
MSSNENVSTAKRGAPRLVVMGVAGCGKSTVGAAIAQALGLPLIEGDDHHGPANKAKMQAGVPLTDEDRAGWLATLGRALAAQAAQGAVLTCSALKRAYRDQLRAAAPGLQVVYLHIEHAEARARVSARAGHFFSSQLVDDQFATLEDPRGESGVLTVSARQPVADTVRAVEAWVAGTS